MSSSLAASFLVSIFPLFITCDPEKPADCRNYLTEKVTETKTENSKTST